ncbi:DNA transfer protein [Providencia rettgeri]|uniref:phage DNA ejection protein n=1 Tax=Providencia rettgeri TaxID=587 RepID=UPI001FBABFC7|nr:phage DNA ejection protein [Providencia rettgeri]MCJ2222155.1 DNA transfer protein [Providencia rettgeri]
MATWNQGINSGGFLGGIGQVNSNAPSASDINPTLGLIRENNDLQRSGANNWGLQGLAGLSGVAQVMNEQQAQERLKEFQGKWGQAYANGDRTAMRQLMAEYPDQAERITGGMKGISDDVRESLGNLSSGYSLAVKSGTVEDYARKNADEFRRLGIDPQGAVDMALNDPKAAMELADHLGLSSLGIDKYYDVRDKMEGRVIERDKLAEDARQADMEHSRVIRGQDISRANALTSAYAPTSAMQNYSQYAQMLKTDPEGAKAFAQAAGIDSTNKKLMKVEKNDDGSVTKYYTDGSEEAGSLSQPIKDDGMRKPMSVVQADTILGKASEGAKQAAGFAMRVKEGQDAMRTLIDSGSVSPARAAFISQNLGDGMVANTALSPAEQTYLVHARDVTNAILRKDTGAAITQPEMIEYGKMYLPQPGDSAKALETKAKKIDARFKTLRGESGLVYEAMNVSSKAYDASEPKSQVSQTNQPQQPQQVQSAPQQSTQQYSEGMTATNPSTGQKMIFRGGKWQQM